MRPTKRFQIFLLIILLFSLSGCLGGGSDSGDGSDSAEATPTPTPVDQAGDDQPTPPEARHVSGLERKLARMREELSAQSQQAAQGFGQFSPAPALPVPPSSETPVAQAVTAPADPAPNSEFVIPLLARKLAKLRLAENGQVRRDDLNSDDATKITDAGAGENGVSSPAEDVPTSTGDDRHLAGQAPPSADP